MIKVPRVSSFAHERHQPHHTYGKIYGKKMLNAYHAGRKRLKGQKEYQFDIPSTANGFMNLVNHCVLYLIISSSVHWKTSGSNAAVINFKYEICMKGYIYIIEQ